MNKAWHRTYFYISIIILSAQLLLLSCHSVAANKAKLRVITSIGSFTIELDHKKAPHSVQRILAYVDAGFYNGVIFHRVIKNFMVQTGAFDQHMNRLMPTEPALQSEADNGLKNNRGTVAMARNTDPHSAVAQFFINTINNPHLDHKAKTDSDWGYTVIGKVISGMNVVRRMSRVTTNDKNLPVKAIIIKSINRI